MRGGQVGRVEEPSGISLLTASEIAVHLLRSCKSLPRFDSYLFGSTLTGIGRDIDILVVGPAGSLLTQLKEELRLAGKHLPLHIVYMLPSEACQTDFVVKERCVPLTQLASDPDCSYRIIPALRCEDRSE